VPAEALAFLSEGEASLIRVQQVADEEDLSE